MHRILAALAGLLIAAPSYAQRDIAAYTNPAVPPARDLDRLNLAVDWKVNVPVTSRGDGLASVQLIEGQVFVQTRSSLLVVLDEATGAELWRHSMLHRNVPVWPVAVNRDLVLITNGPRLFILDRKDGKQKYNIELASTVAAGLAADVHQCFVVLSNNRLVSVGLQPQDVQRGLTVPRRFNQPEPPTGVTLTPQGTGELSTTRNVAPSVTLLHSLKPPFRNNGRDVSPSLNTVPTLRPPYVLDTGARSPSIQMMNNLSRVAEYTEINSFDRPRILWELQANRRMDEAPLMYGEFLIVAMAEGGVFVCDKHAERQNRIRHEYLADSTLSAPVVLYGPDIIICVSDGNAYLINIENFRNNDIPVKHLKRYLTGLPIDRRPIVTDDSVFLAGSTAGLTRLDRKTFEKVWSNADVDRVYAVNSKVVYGADRRGNLVVLDRARGIRLASLDVHDFNFPISNDRDDRLFLAGNNGLLVCMHDRAFRRPELLRPKEPPPPPDPYDIYLDKGEPKVDPNMMPPAMGEPKKEEPKKEEMKKEVP